MDFLSVKFAVLLLITAIANYTLPSQFRVVGLLISSLVFYFIGAGEFLALVHGLALLKQHNLSMPIYSDSVNAMAWVRAKKCRTKLARTEKNIPVFDLIARAERWLEANHYTTRIIKWDTVNWGEIPADFGRK